MTRKSLFAIALIVGASSSVFALDLVKGKLLEHKQWTTGKMISDFKTEIFDHNTLTRLLGEHKNDDMTFISATAHMDMDFPINPAGKPTYLSGSTDIFISNYTSASKKFTINQGVCTSYDPIDPLHQFMRICILDMNVIQIDAGGYLALSSKPGASRTYTDAGKYFASTYTEVLSDDEKGRTAYFTSDDHFIDVPAAIKK